MNMKDDQDFNIWFVKEIEKYTCLYNHTEPNYTNRQIQEESWKTIATNANATVGECKERWKNLRACFSRHLKHRIIEMRTGMKHKKPYYLAEHMNFILPFTKVRSFPEDKMKYFSDVIKTLDLVDNVIYVDSNDDMDDNESKYDVDVEASYQDGDYDTMEEPLQNQDNNMIVRMHVNESSLIEERADDYPLIKRKRIFEGSDPDLDFFKSLLPDVRSMTGSQKRKFKINVLKLVDEIFNSPGPSQTL